MASEKILYTTHCPMCTAVKSALDASGISYTECDDEEKMLALGFERVPVFFDGESYLYKPSEIVSWARAHAAK